MADKNVPYNVHYIHTTCNCRLWEKFECSDQTPPVPVLVVAEETGKELVALINEHPRYVEGRVDTALKGFILSPNVSSHSTPSQSECHCTFVHTVHAILVYTHCYVCYILYENSICIPITLRLVLLALL